MAYRTRRAAADQYMMAARFRRHIRQLLADRGYESASFVDPPSNPVRSEIQQLAHAELWSLLPRELTEGPMRELGMEMLRSAIATARPICYGGPPHARNQWQHT